MAVQTYTGNPYFFTMTVGYGANSEITEIENLSEFSLQWQRPIRYVKNLSDSAPYIAYGSSQGQFTLQGKAVTAQVSTSMTTSRAIFDGINPNPTAAVAVIIQSKSNKGGSIASAAYSGYPTGKGFTYRQISERYWILDGVQTFQFID